MWVMSGLLAATLSSCVSSGMLERARNLELDTPYVAPPGEALSHHAAGYAKVLCSAVFVSGFELDFAAANLGFFVAPLEERARLKPSLDRDHRAVDVTLPDGRVRGARQVGGQGCVTLPPGATEVSFTPTAVPSS